MRRLLVLFPLLLAGCLRDADPVAIEEHPLHVHAVLQAGATSATMLLSRPEPQGHVYRPVSGAEVRLTRGGETVLLTERPHGEPCVVVGRTAVGDGAGCYSAVLPEPIQAGATYELEVLTTDRRVTGSTTIPGAIEFTAPDAGAAYAIPCPPPGATPVCQSDFGDQPPFELIPLATIVVEWVPPAGAERVEAVFRPKRVVKDGTEYPGDHCEVEPSLLYEPLVAPGGSARWPVHSVYCRGPLDVIGWDTIYVDAVVPVYDSAYATYMDAVLGRDAARVEVVTAGIEGAFGVFGAANARAWEVALVRVEE